MKIEFDTEDTKCRAVPECSELSLMKGAEFFSDVKAQSTHELGGVLFSWLIADFFKVGLGNDFVS